MAQAPASAAHRRALTESSFSGAAAIRLLHGLYFAFRSAIVYSKQERAIHIKYRKTSIALAAAVLAPGIAFGFRQSGNIAVSTTTCKLANASRAPYLERLYLLPQTGDASGNPACAAARRRLAVRRHPLHSCSCTAHFLTPTGKPRFTSFPGVYRRISAVSKKLR